MAYDPKTASKDETNAMRAGFSAGYLTALEQVAAETGDQNTRAICQRLRERAQRIYTEAVASLPDVLAKSEDRSGPRGR